MEALKGHMPLKIPYQSVVEMHSLVWPVLLLWIMSNEICRVLHNTLWIPSPIFKTSKVSCIKRPVRVWEHWILVLTDMICKKFLSLSLWTVFSLLMLILFWWHFTAQFLCWLHCFFVDVSRHGFAILHLSV